MALLTAEKAPATSRIAKQYRVLYRCDNGSVVYESVNDTEGEELLTVHPDGSMSSHIIIGVCRPCWEVSMHGEQVRDGSACGLGEQCPSVKSEAKWVAMGVERRITCSYS